MAEAGDAGKVKLLSIGCRYPDGLHVRQELCSFQILDAEKVQILRFFAHNHVVFHQLTACERNFVEVKRVAQRGQIGIGADVDAGEGHAEVKIKRAAQLNEFIIEGLVVHGFPNIG